MNTEQNREVILRKLRITDLQYCEMVERGGYEWLRRYFSHVPDMIDICKYSAMFWKWWVNEWNLRDNRFLALNRFKIWPVHIEESSYNFTHDIDGLGIRPNRFVIEEVNKIIKNQEEKI